MIYDLHVLDAAAVLPRAAGIVHGHFSGEPRTVLQFEDDPRLDEAVIPKRLAKRIDRFSAIAMQAVARLDWSSIEPPVSLMVANNYAGWTYGGRQLNLYCNGGIEAMNAYLATAWFPAAAQGEISIEHQITGATKTFASESGLDDALRSSTHELANGYAKTAVVVAVESCIDPISVDAVFPQSHDSFVLGEGAVALLLGDSSASAPTALSPGRLRTAPSSRCNSPGYPGCLGPALDLLSRLPYQKLEATLDVAAVGHIEESIDP